MADFSSPSMRGPQPARRPMEKDEPSPCLVLGGLRTEEPQIPSLQSDENRTEEELEPVFVATAHDDQNLDLALVDSPFGMLPFEITLEILRHLNVSDLKSSFLVCKLWALERGNELLWKTVVFRKYGEWAPLKPSGMTWRMLALACGNVIEQPPVHQHLHHQPPAPQQQQQQQQQQLHHPHHPNHVHQPLQPMAAAFVPAAAAVPPVAAGAPAELPHGGLPVVTNDGFNGLGRFRVTRLAAHLNGEFVGQCRGGLPHGLGILRYEQGNLYFGTWQSGKREGYGEYRWKNGNMYCGEWRDDKQNGLGEFKWNDGDYYKGEWQDDHRHGKGMYIWPKGSFYEGEFHMNDLHNYGRYTWKSGYYEGGWRNSTRHGKGVIRWTNGNCFEGEFANNAKSGYGVYRWSDGATYSGTWEADDRWGQAVTVWANGMSYIGKYVRDLRNGEGTLRWPNGDIFEGFWRNGGRFGKGVFTEFATGRKTEQVWKEEEKIQYSKGIPARFPPNM